MPRPTATNDASAAAKKSIDRKELIIEAATRLFAEKGFEGVRLHEVAKMAGCNNQLIFYYYTSKVGLWEAVLARQIEMTAPLWEVIPGSTFEQLLHYEPRSSDLDPQAEHSTLWNRLLMREGVDYVNAQVSPIQLHETREKTWAIQTDTIRDAQARGNIRGDLDPEMLSYFVALNRYHGRILPQVAKLISGEEHDDARFKERWMAFLTQLADALKPAN